MFNFAVNKSSLNFIKITVYRRVYRLRNLVKTLMAVPFVKSVTSAERINEQICFIFRIINVEPSIIFNKASEREVLKVLNNLVSKFTYGDDLFWQKTADIIDHDIPTYY